MQEPRRLNHCEVFPYLEFVPLCYRTYPRAQLFITSPSLSPPGQKVEVFDSGFERHFRTPAVPGYGRYELLWWELLTAEKQPLLHGALLCTLTALKIF